MVHIAADKLQSTLGLKLPPVFTFLPSMASRPGHLPEGQGAAKLCRDTTGPNTNACIWKSWEELPQNLLNLVTGQNYETILAIKCKRIVGEIKGGTIGRESGREIGREVGEKTGEKVGESLGETKPLHSIFLICTVLTNVGKMKHE